MAEDGLKVDVVGLRETQKVLREADPLLARELRKRQKDLATEIVEGAQSRAEAEGGIEAKAAQALSAKGEQRFAKIVLDGNKFPYVLGGEFGALQYHQFKPWRGNQYTDPLGQDVGYFLHPEIRAQRDHIVDTYDEIVRDLLERIARA